MIFLAAAVMAAAAVFLLVSRKQSVPVRIAQARYGDLSVAVLCDGTLEPGASGELRAPEAAAVSEIDAGEGERVEAGRILVRLENPDLLAKALEARSAVLQLFAERETARADLARLHSDLDQRARTAEADERLLAAGAISRQTRDEDAAALRETSSRAASARARLESLEGGRTAESRVSISERSAAELERRVAALTLRAPSAGIVFGLPRRIGERVESGQVVASVADPARLRVRARVDEPDLPRIAPGQRVSVTFDGLPDRRWDGRVTLAAAGLREYSGRRVGEVLAEISDPDRKLPPNASVNVSIIAGEKSRALVIPRAALQRDGARRWIFVLDAGRARRRDVTIGLLGLSEAEVVSGLREGERVILPGAGTLSDGLRVKVEGS
jgi:HlyD family secretion protein